MTYEKEHERQTRIIIEHLQKINAPLTNDDKTMISHAVKEAYINGYNDGVTDGKDISENPISG